MSMPDLRFGHIAAHGTMLIGLLGRGIDVPDVFCSVVSGAADLAHVVMLLRIRVFAQIAVGPRMRFHFGFACLLCFAARADAFFSAGLGTGCLLYTS